MSAPADITMIVEAISEHFGITTPELLSDDRTKRLSRPRQVAYLICRELTRHSTTAIGRVFRRDHSTITVSTNRLRSVAARSTDLCSTLNALRARCGNALGKPAEDNQDWCVVSRARLLFDVLVAEVGPTDDPGQLLIAVGQLAARRAADPDWKPAVAVPPAIPLPSQWQPRPKRPPAAHVLASVRERVAAAADGVCPTYREIAAIANCSEWKVRMAVAFLKRGGEHEEERTSGTGGFRRRMRVRIEGDWSGWTHWTGPNGTDAEPYAQTGNAGHLALVLAAGNYREGARV